MKIIHVFFTLMILLLLSSCAAFMHGYTDDKALNAYYLVNGDKHNFGDRRVYYNQRFHHNTDLDNYLNKLGKPDMIYEYEAKEKHIGLQLFYIAKDSVYVFDSKRKHCTCMSFLESRKIDEYEKATYLRLLNK